MHYCMTTLFSAFVTAQQRTGSENLNNSSPFRVLFTNFFFIAEDQQTRSCFLIMVLFSRGADLPERIQQNC